MTAIAAISLLAAVALYVTGNHYKNRAANLETLLQFEREQFNDLVLSLDEHELLRQLDDTCRELAHVRHLHATLLAENTTLCVDLMLTEQRNVYLEALHRQRKGETAGVLLTEFLVNPKRKMTVWSEVP